MSIQAESLPPEMWAHVAKYSNPQSVNTLSQVCKNSREGTLDFATLKIQNLKEYSKNEWGGKRLHYLLEATKKFSSPRQLTLIFNEIRRCGQTDNCNTFDDIEYSVAEAGKEQAKSLTTIFCEITKVNHVAKQFFKENKFTKWLRFRDYDEEEDFKKNLDQVLAISDWMETNQEILDQIETIEICYSKFNKYYNKNSIVNFPHELKLFRNIKNLKLESDGTPFILTSLPIEIQKMNKLEISWPSNFSIEPAAQKDYAPHLYHKQVNEIDFDVLIKPCRNALNIDKFRNSYFSYIYFLFVLIIAILCLLLSGIRYGYLVLIAYVELKMNEPTLPF